MADHTPGPWVMVLSLNFAKGRAKYSLESSSAHLWMGDVWLTHSVADAAQAANARLISAAPELLAACETAFEALAEVEEWNEQIDDDASRVPLDTRERLRKAAHSARSAIAKAKGL